MYICSVVEESGAVGLNLWSSVGLLVKSRGLLDTLRGMVSGWTEQVFVWGG